MEKLELMEKITGEKSPKFITKRENLLLDGLLHLINVKESLEKENERLKEALNVVLRNFKVNKQYLQDLCQAEIQAGITIIEKALQNLYNFNLGKEGYLDSCLNDAEYALHLSTVKEVGNNE